MVGVHRPLSGPAQMLFFESLDSLPSEAIRSLHKGDHMARVYGDEVAAKLAEMKVFVGYYLNLC